MSGLAHALPRIRARRRRPPGVLFWYLLAGLLFSCAALVFDVVFLARGSAICAVCAVPQAAWTAWFGGQFGRELERWRRDDDR
jgi:hypothetical protein